MGFSILVRCRLYIDSGPRSPEISLSRDIVLELSDRVFRCDKQLGNGATKAPANFQCGMIIWSTISCIQDEIYRHSDLSLSELRPMGKSVTTILLMIQISLLCFSWQSNENHHAQCIIGDITEYYFSSIELFVFWCTVKTLCGISFRL